MASHSPSHAPDDNGEASKDLSDENNNTDFDYRNNTNNNNSNDDSGFDYRIKNHDDIPPLNDSHLGLELGYLPPDQRPGMPVELIAQLADPEIEDDTEAAEALRANANIKVRKMGKVARSLNAQSVRRFVKFATLRGKSGNRKGKPPRIPPGRTAVEDPDSNIFVVTEEPEEEVSSQEGDDISQQGSAGEASVPSMAQDDHQSHESAGAGPPPAAPASTQGKQHAVSDQHHAHTIDMQNPTPIGPVTHTDAVLLKNKHMRHSSVIDEAKDIPADVVAATMEAGRKFLGAVDPHNMLQLQRWRRKKKHAGEKSRKSYVKGKVIDGRHELYTLSIAVMLGVRTSIAKTNTIITSANGRRILTPHDFMTEEKYEFSPKGSLTTPPHKLSHTFKFKDYAPMAFAYLRRMFGVNEFDFLLSVCGNANFIEFISNAKSGQFFFYSSDGKYMIKTMTNEESKFLRRILPHYFRHCTKNPNTLITRFLGMYRVKLYHLRRNVKFVIMNSVYHTDKYLQTFYDLKGSELGRTAKPGQDVLKDNDLRQNLAEQAMSLHPELRARVRTQMVSDCNFLSSMKIMDYSLLMGVHHIPPKEPDYERGSSIAKTGFRIRKERQNSKNLRNKTSHGHFDGDDSSGYNSDGHSAGGSVELPSRTGSATTDSRNGVKKECTVAEQQRGDSTRKLINDIRDSNVPMTNFEFAGLLEEEDDCSYLELSGPSNADEEAQRNIARYQAHPKYADIELKKEQTIEQIYWPFHRYYDINGFRRMKPKACFRCNAYPCTCENHKKLVQAWKIPEFVPPLSNRKDGGLMMNTTGLEMPLTLKGPTGERQYEGKIFYMGIIDILQQFNVRKRVETNYRKIDALKGQDPSCVHPDDYAERFIRFFDEYSDRCAPPTKSEWKKTVTEEENTAIETSLTNGQGKEAVGVSFADVAVDVSSKQNGSPRK